MTARNDPKKSGRPQKRPAQTKKIEYATSWVNRACAPRPVATLFGVLACELEAHSVRLISRGPGP